MDDARNSNFWPTGCRAPLDKVITTSQSFDLLTGGQCTVADYCVIRDTIQIGLKAVSDTTSQLVVFPPDPLRGHI
jgi:hypothetical protein